MGYGPRWERIAQVSSTSGKLWQRNDDWNGVPVQAKQRTSFDILLGTRGLMSSEESEATEVSSSPAAPEGLLEIQHEFQPSQSVHLSARKADPEERSPEKRFTRVFDELHHFYEGGGVGMRPYSLPTSSCHHDSINICQPTEWLSRNASILSCTRAG